MEQETNGPHDDLEPSASDVLALADTMIELSRQERERLSKLQESLEQPDLKPPEPPEL